MTFQNVENRQSITDKQDQSQVLNGIKFRAPTAVDGYAITSLIRQSPPLDNNSAYCNLLQCTHFAETCIIAESSKGIMGWISAYRPPDQTEHLFIWQVAVHANARGQGLAKHMLQQLLSRQALASVRYISTTITKNNQASWSLFKGFAKRHQLDLNEYPHFDHAKHFHGMHDTEFLVKIGPFDIQDIKKQGVSHD